MNSFGLGDTGRYRTNVWDYPGVSSMGAARHEMLAMHPTVKPTALVADAIRDCSKRGDMVLDCFAGSGATLIAAERAGRVARLIEYDPSYCDTIVRRFEKVTGKQGLLESSGSTFEDVEAERLADDTEADTRDVRRMPILLRPGDRRSLPGRDAEHDIACRFDDVIRDG